MTTFAILMTHWRAALIALLSFTVLLMSGLYIKRGHNIERLQVAHTKYVSEHAALVAVEQVKARAIETSYQAKLAEANQNAITQIKAANDAANSARDAVTSLRKQTANASTKLPTATSEASVDYAITCGTVLDDLAEFGGAIAASSDGHAIDARRLSESWPQ